MFYGITKDPETKEFMMIIQLADKGNLKSILSSNFNNILWEDKNQLLLSSAQDLKNLHKLGYFHKDFHSGNILHSENIVNALKLWAEPKFQSRNISASKG